MTRPTTPRAARGHVSSRRDFLRRSGMVAAAATLGNAAALLAGRGWLPTARADDGAPDPLRDTFDGLLAFIVPGDDAFSQHQGVSTPEPGGVGAGVTATLIENLDLVLPFLPNFSQTVAGVLNGVAQAVNPAADGPFAAPFANLNVAEKATVFALLESGAIDPTLVPLAGALPSLVGFLAYSEAGVLDPTTGALTETPLGWRLSGYGGVSDGHNELKGYFQRRRRAHDRSD